MSKIHWFFMSKYRKLLYQIETASANHQRLCLHNGIVIDFTYEGKVDATNQELARLRKENSHLRQVIRDFVRKSRRAKAEK